MTQFSDETVAVEVEINRIRSLGLHELRALWRETFMTVSPLELTKDILMRKITHFIQQQAFGGLDRTTAKLLDEFGRGTRSHIHPQRHLKVGTVLVREYQGQRHTVTVAPNGYVWQEATYKNLSAIARTITGTTWSGPRFFGLRKASDKKSKPLIAQEQSAGSADRRRTRQPAQRTPAVRLESRT